MAAQGSASRLTKVLINAEVGSRNGELSVERAVIPNEEFFPDVTVWLRVDTPETAVPLKVSLIAAKMSSLEISMIGNAGASSMFWCTNGRLSIEV